MRLHEICVKLNTKYRHYSWDLRRRVDNLYRRVEIIVLEYDLGILPEITNISMLREDCTFYVHEGNETRDLQDIVNSFPDYVSFTTPSTSELMLKDDISKFIAINTPCFVARDKATNKLLGAMWAPDWCFTNILPSNKRDYKSIAIGKLYIVPDARDYGISVALLKYAINYAKDNGYKYLFSFVKPKLFPILFAHINVGFKVLGTAIHGSFLGQKFQKFRHGIRIIQEAFPIVPVVIVSSIHHDGSTLLSTIRALGRNGIPVYVLAKGPLTYSGKTRYAQSIEQFTDDISDNELMQRLTAILEVSVKQNQKPVLIHISENDIFRLHSIMPFLKEHFIVVPSDNAINFLEKSDQLPLAIKAGFKVPKSVVLSNSNDIESVSEKLDYPIIVKPLARHTMGSFTEKALIFDTQESFVEKISHLFDDKRTELIVQEYIPGDDTNVLIFMASCDSQGKVRACVSGRKLRQIPPGFGLMSSGVIDKNETMENISKKLCLLFKIGGFIGIEAKMRQGTEDLYYIETNFRPEAISALAETVGTNLVLDIYMNAIGQPCFASSPGPNGSYLNLQYEIDAIRQLVHEGKAKWIELFRPMPRPTAYSLFALDDPLPFLRWLAEAVWLKLLRLLNIH